MKEKQLYTIAEVAEILETTEAYVHRLRKAGMLTCMKLGRYKVRHSTLCKFLADHDGMDVDGILLEKEMKE